MWQRAEPVAGLGVDEPVPESQGLCTNLTKGKQQTKHGSHGGLSGPVLRCQ